MSKKIILPIATALAALSTSAAPNPINAATPQTDTVVPAPGVKGDLRPTMVIATGEDLLGLIVSNRADGTVVADHYSHVSHASHASHASHYSSRY